jgi:hypothetical protein
VAKTRKKPKRVNVKAAEIMRARGISYGEIARAQHVTPTAVFYALDPRRRTPREKAAGANRSVYFSDGLWGAITDAAAREGTSASRLLASIAVGEHEPVTVEPGVTGVADA